MYEAVFCTPSDFKESDSEQYLSAYWGKLSIYPSTSRLGIVRALLNNNLDIRLECSEGYDDWHIPQDFMMSEGRDEVSYHLNLVSNPTHLERFDVSRIRRFWKMRNDWNDVVIVGAATDSWIVLHWYTTV